MALMSYLSVENENLEEGVHQKDAIWLDRRSIEENRLGRSVEGVRVQDRLYHDQALSQVFTEQTGSGNFITKCIETMLKQYCFHIVFNLK